jgi:hypothetical protein
VKAAAASVVAAVVVGSRHRPLVFKFGKEATYGTGRRGGSWGGHDADAAGSAQATFFSDLALPTTTSSSASSSSRRMRLLVPMQGRAGRAAMA